jgi:hypothetical protein
MKAPAWFVFGCVSLGLLIGFMVGLSISPIVSTVLGLVFAFTGGSVIVLIKGREEGELRVIGKSLSAISLSMIAGMVLGISFRANDWLSVQPPEPPADAVSVPYQLDQPLSLAQIITLSEKGTDPVTLRTLLKAQTQAESPIQVLSFDDLSNLVDSKVHPLVIQALVDLAVLLDDSPYRLTLQDIKNLHKDGLPDSIIQELINRDHSVQTIQQSDEGQQQGTWLYQKHEETDVIDRLNE